MDHMTGVAQLLKKEQDRLTEELHGLRLSMPGLLEVS